MKPLGMNLEGKEHYETLYARPLLAAILTATLVGDPFHRPRAGAPQTASSAAKQPRHRAVSLGPDLNRL